RASPLADRSVPHPDLHSSPTRRSSDLLKEAGLPSLLLIVAFLCAVFHEILVLPRRDPYKYAYAASFVAAACHYAVISDIWYPWLDRKSTRLNSSHQIISYSVFRLHEAT